MTELKLRLPDGTVRVPPEPIAVEDPDGHDFIDHLVFDWNSMGGLFTLCELKIGGGASIAATHSDYDGYSLVALIEPDTQSAWSAYYRRLFLTNGTAFGFGLFGSPPREIVNYKPDLLTNDLVRDAMWDNFQVLEAEDHDGFQSSLGEIFERMPPLDQDGRVAQRRQPGWRRHFAPRTSVALRLVLAAQLPANCMAAARRRPPDVTNVDDGSVRYHRHRPEPARACHHEIEIVLRVRGEATPDAQFQP